MSCYEVGFLGTPDAALLSQLRAKLKEAGERFGLRWGVDLKAVDVSGEFRPPQTSVAALVVFGSNALAACDVGRLYDSCSVPALPIASADKRVEHEVPAELRQFNCLFLNRDSPDRICSTILALLGLLPEQRRLFLSYRRGEGTPAAIQLFAALSEIQYRVFLDTHCIDAGAAFQEALWHQMCDSDVLVMLETDGYFESRWTDAEYGRALSKGIGVLRITWPDSTPNKETGTESRVELLADELLPDGTLAPSALERIALRLEQLRVLSHAVRLRSLLDGLRAVAERVGCVVGPISPNRGVDVQLRSGRRVLVQPVLGVPTSLMLQAAIERAESSDTAVVYDHLGIRPAWIQHMSWLVANRPNTRWMKATDAAWDLAGWETEQ